MTDDGFKEDIYLRHVKQLRYNYTSYDIDAKSPEVKQQILNAINKFSQPKPKQNHQLLQIYEWATNECKDKKDPEGDN